MISPARVISISQTARGVSVQCEHEAESIEALETFDALGLESNCGLLVFTAVGFFGVDADDRARFGGQIAINTDYLTITDLQDPRGTVVRVSGSEREIVVLETAQQIELLLNENHKG